MSQEDYIQFFLNKIILALFYRMIHTSIVTHTTKAFTTKSFFFCSEKLQKDIIQCKLSTIQLKLG